MNVTDVSEVLRARGHRVTRARVAVWEALAGAGSHLTVEEIAQRVGKSEPGTNVASVYRALTLFEQLELARPSRLGSAQGARWELAHPDEHFHLVCQRCGGITHHLGTFVEQVRDHLAVGHGYHASEIQLTVSGCCAACSGRGGDETAT